MRGQRESWSIAGELSLDAAHAWPLVRDALGLAIITHADRLGGIALVVHFELEARDAPETLERLRAAGLRLTEGEAPHATEGELLGHLHVTLAHGGPDERVEIPQVG